MYEIKPWKKEGCSLSVKVESLSRRETWSREINEAFGEGGALNANYQTVEAVAKASGILERNGLRYGTDFVWKTGGMGEISFDFKDDVTRQRAKTALAPS